MLRALEASVNRSTVGELRRSEESEENGYTDAPEIDLLAVSCASVVQVVVVVIEEQKNSVLSTKQD